MFMYLNYNSANLYFMRSIVKNQEKIGKLRLYLHTFKG